MVMVEAYKKWVLVSLLEHKKSIALPNVVTAQTAKIYRSLARPYIALATSFDEDNYERLKIDIDVGRSIWQTDNNTGLVFQVMEKFRSAAILRLGRSFAALTVSDVAAHVSLSSISTKEMESFLASLITFGVMNATLFHSCDKSSKTTLRFLMKTSGLSAAQELRAHKRLLQEAHLLRVLVDNIMQSNHVLELSSEHIEDLRKTQRRVENGAKGNSDMPIGGEVSEFDFDEDMMGDLH
ncbi:hypothetical protein MPDQ_001122 [Monascus purpureus]|uniref:COP9 signalosome complex subunit 3 n=1 Tax=Monascus purpureus TaxID=5098 RepID=A0A507QS41_MONPU|nr:hypothetical protein MPDQ_001122 [Monascus purpureus]